MVLKKHASKFKTYIFLKPHPIHPLNQKKLIKNLKKLN